MKIFFWILTATHVYAWTTTTNNAVNKPTGTSFLPEETVQRAAQGSPVEKIKLKKDGTSAFIDVYEYARKIREGEMTWEEVETADLDTVRLRVMATTIVVVVLS